MNPCDNKKRGFWAGRCKSFTYAWSGIKTLFRLEHNAQFHLGAAVLVIIAGFLFNISGAEWTAVILCIAGMFMAEGFNTAIEELADYACGGKKHPAIGRAKDVAAGAVLMMAVGSVAVGLVIFLPKIIGLLR